MKPSFRPLLLLTLALCALAARAGDAAGAEAARIVVTGSATVHAAPDRAAFVAGITTEGRDADAVLDRNAERAERVLAALRGAGVDVERLQTRGVRLEPRSSQRPRDAGEAWRPEIVGYRAVNRVEVETADLERVGALLAAAVDAGADAVDGIRFRLEDEEPARDRAIRRATADALREARVMAEAAGVRPGAVLELRLDQASTSLPRPIVQGRMELAAMDASVRSVPVAPGRVRIDARVTITLAGAP